MQSMTTGICARRVRAHCPSTNRRASRSRPQLPASTSRASDPDTSSTATPCVRSTSTRFWAESSGAQTLRSRSTRVGAQLNSQWNVGAQHALYRANGTWCHWLQRFPGALFDANGYVRFETEDDLLGCSGVRVGERANWLNVPDGIASLPGYVTVQQA